MIPLSNRPRARGRTTVTIGGLAARLLERDVRPDLREAGLWIGGLGALGGFVIPPVIGVVTGAVGGTTGYARGFLPVAVLVLIAFPVVIWLQRWTSRSANG